MHSKMLYGGFFFYFHPQLLSTISVLLRSDLCWRAGSPALFTFSLISLIPAISIVLSFAGPVYLMGSCFSNISFAWHSAASLYDHCPGSSWVIDSHDPFESECSISYVYLRPRNFEPENAHENAAYHRQISIFSYLFRGSFFPRKQYPQRRFSSNIVPTLCHLLFSPNILLTPLSPFNPLFGPSLYRLFTVD